MPSEYWDCERWWKSGEDRKQQMEAHLKGKEIPRWTPHRGPQTLGHHCQTNNLYYGDAAASGGKFARQSQVATRLQSTSAAARLLTSICCTAIAANASATPKTVPCTAPSKATPSSVVMNLPPTSTSSSNPTSWNSSGPPAPKR